MRETFVKSGGNVAVVNPLSDSGWNGRIVRCSNSTIFHSANWARLLADTYGYRPMYLTLSDDTGATGYLPLMEISSIFTGRRGVSLSFCDFCGAIVKDEADFLELFEAAVEIGRNSGWRYLEFRGEKFLQHQVPARTYAHHSVALVDDEVVMQSRLRDSTARNIRKAVKEGVEVTTCQSLEGIMNFYRLHCLTRKRQGVPPQPRRFFKKLHEHIIAKGLGFTALASYRQAIVAGMVCLHFGRHGVYKYGASDLDFQNVRANNLVMWEAMMRCAREGCCSFSLGRTDLCNEGLINFKNGWGATPDPLNYYKFDVTCGKFLTGPQTKGASYAGVLKMLPLNVLRLIGEAAYRHLG